MPNNKPDKFQSSISHKGQALYGQDNTMSITIKRETVGLQVFSYGYGVMLANLIFNLIFLIEPFIKKTSVAKRQ
jgi:hypothetical protein